MTTKAVVVAGAFGLDHLLVVERADARPPPGHVAIDVRAVSLNYRDLLMVQGKYNPKQPLPLVPCSDGAGVVVEVGAGVARVQPGDRVVGMFAQGWLAGPATKAKVSRTLGGPLDGMLSERVVLPEDGVAKSPAHLTDVEAATLPCAALTAWSALCAHAPITAGEVVVVQGTGGVALFALQIAKLCGARVIATSSTDEKRARLTALGADDAIDRAGWEKRVRELTGGVGADHIVDVGGAATIAQSLRAVKVGGTVSVVGNLGGNEAPVSVIPILMQDLRVQGVLVGHRDSFVAMTRAFEMHAVRPVVDRVFGFFDARAAFDHLAAAAHVGKVVLAR